MTPASTPDVNSPPVSLAVVGAGDRGSAYAGIAAAGGNAVITAVADPHPGRRQAFADRFGIAPDRVLDDWRELSERPRLADAVVIATPDRVHADPAVAFADLGYAILLEKPMAPTAAEADRIVAAAVRNDVLLAVCHVLRYSAYSRKLREVVGRIGDIVTVQHLEPVGWWHQAHSYVRGNWAVAADSSPMLLAKSCHDIDWLTYIIGRPVVRVSSFGGLYEFRPERRPPGATERCLDCPVERECAYSAVRIYHRFVDNPSFRRWPLPVLTDDVTAAGVDRALRDGPYGLCVYLGRNDVVDHQVVNLEYTDGVTASFTMTAFTPLDHRKTRLFGTAGAIDGDGSTIRVHEFLTDTVEVIDPDPTGGASAADGHGGADRELVRAFLAAVATGDRSLVTSGPAESIASHHVVWAAEQARHTGTVVHMGG